MPFTAIISQPAQVLDVQGGFALSQKDAPSSHHLSMIRQSLDCALLLIVARNAPHPCCRRRRRVFLHSLVQSLEQQVLRLAAVKQWLRQQLGQLSPNHRDSLVLGFSAQPFKLCHNKRTVLPVSPIGRCFPLRVHI